MHQKKEFIIVKDRHPYISEVLNDCISLCVSTKRNESLSSILQKICNKINNNFSQLSSEIADLDANRFQDVPIYADNAAAITAGLVIGDIYRTGDLLKIVHE